MYEVAPVAGNKCEAACALQSLSNIMGQITSSQQNGKSSRGKVYPRHSVTLSQTSTTSGGGGGTVSLRKGDELYQKHLKESIKTNALTLRNNPSLRLSERPVTISQMNAYNAEKSGEAIKSSAEKEKLLEHLVKIRKNKEFYTVGEGYHKTECCYYKTPDGGFHKLPPDSFHKMSEICYTKLPDGSFRRLEELNINGQLTTDCTSNASQNKVRNQMIRFLKRSKSHTPATIKEIQKTKEKEQERVIANRAVANNRSSAASTGNRKVVVTMMENGGLPIIATSKSNRPDPVSKDRSSLKYSRSGASKVTGLFFFSI